MECHLDRVRPFAEQLGDLAGSQVGAVAQGDQLARPRIERLHRLGEVECVGDGRRKIVCRAAIVDVGRGHLTPASARCVGEHPRRDADQPRHRQAPPARRRSRGSAAPAPPSRTPRPPRLARGRCGRPRSCTAAAASPPGVPAGHGARSAPPRSHGRLAAADGQFPRTGDVNEDLPTRNPDVVFRRLDDEVVLVNMKTNLIYALNPTAARFWELLRRGSSGARRSRRGCSASSTWSAGDARHGDRHAARGVRPRGHRRLAVVHHGFLLWCDAGAEPHLDSAPTTDVARSEQLTVATIGAPSAADVAAEYRRSGTIGSPSGPAAAVVIDHGAGTVLAARDQTGLQPLFFATGANGFGVSSDARALGSRLVCRPSRTAVAAWLVGAPLEPWETLLDGMRQGSGWAPPSSLAAGTGSLSSGLRRRPARGRRRMPPSWTTSRSSGRAVGGRRTRGDPPLRRPGLHGRRGGGRGRGRPTRRRPAFALSVDFPGASERTIQRLVASGLHLTSLEAELTADQSLLARGFDRIATAGRRLRCGHPCSTT